MGLRALPLTPSRNGLLPNSVVGKDFSKHVLINRTNSRFFLVVSAEAKKEDEEVPKKRKQNLFESVTEALDFAQVRSAEDAQLLEDARQATKSGNKMSREQEAINKPHEVFTSPMWECGYGALRRKIGGTYKDFFKSYVDVDGEYVEEGWVDKTCKVCKKDTKGEPRQVDKFGKYVHVACLDKAISGNFFSRLFG